MSYLCQWFVTRCPCSHNLCTYLLISTNRKWNVPCTLWRKKYVWTKNDDALRNVKIHRPQWNDERQTITIYVCSHKIQKHDNYKLLLSSLPILYMYLEIPADYQTYLQQVTKYCIVIVHSHFMHFVIVDMFNSPWVPVFHQWIFAMSP